MKSRIQRLARAFSTLTAEQRERLRAHVKRGTGILCGANYKYFHSSGAG